MSSRLRLVQQSIRRQSSYKKYEYATHRPNITPKDEQEIFQRAQRLKAILMGLGALTALVGAAQTYKHRQYIKSKIWGDNFDLESFDEMYDRIKQKKKAKTEKAKQLANSVTNTNDTSVPGIYICGNDEYGLVSGDFEKKSSSTYMPMFKRLDIFDGFIVRDVVLSQKSGALIDDKGNLYQWGKGFGGDSKNPTLKGYNFTKVQISNGVLYLLTKNGQVYYVPENFSDQSTKNGWLGKYIVPGKLSAPKAKDISTGLEHLTLLSTTGKVYTAATGLDGTHIKQSFGQFGLPNLSQFDSPPKPNVLNEVLLLNKFKDGNTVFDRITDEIVTGDYFTLSRDSTGTVWAWGRNNYGAVGKELNYDTEIIPYPTRFDFSIHFKKTQFPQCVKLAAGGDTAFAEVVTSDVYKLFQEALKKGETTSIDDGRSKKSFFFHGGMA
ncbi:Fmp25 protein [Martiniozyma asiatica (nom. inval.)]|nr:Fmp25 protein [Martiniozyma asiatica]